MKNRILQNIHFNLLQVLLIALIITSCGSQKSEETVSIAGDETPPSISGEAQSPVIKLTDKENSELKIQTLVVKDNQRNFIFEAPGLVFPAPEYVSIISTPINGRVSYINALEGNFVSKGQELFKIESLEFGNMVSEYLQAVAEEKFQTSRADRLKQLVEQTISSKSELDRAMSDLQRASASVIAAYSKLKAIGVPNHEIDAFINADQIDPTLKIHSPISGVIDQRLVDLGQSVNALEMLGRIINTGKVLVKGYLSPEDAQYINRGDSVIITLRDSKNKLIDAQITSINPGLDETNRSVVVNIVVATENGWPKPGENVRLQIKSSSMGNTIVIPLDALTYDGNNPVVFVKKGTSAFEKREIKIKEMRQNEAIVSKGLSIGEEVAISQIFSLKALSRYSQISED